MTEEAPVFFEMITSFKQVEWTSRARRSDTKDKACPDELFSAWSLVQQS
jgi:hypothetical protein